MTRIRFVIPAIVLVFGATLQADAQGNAGQVRARESYRTWAQNASRYGMWGGVAGAVVGSTYAYATHAGDPQRKLQTVGSGFIGFAIGVTVGVAVYQVKVLATRNKKKPLRAVSSKAGGGPSLRSGRQDQRTGSQ